MLSGFNLRSGVPLVDYWILANAYDLLFLVTSPFPHGTQRDEKTLFADSAGKVFVNGKESLYMKYIVSFRYQSVLSISFSPTSILPPNPGTGG